VNWPQASIRDVAPPERAAVSFNDDQEVWSLSLDQIESQTGRILGKQRVRAGDAGTSTFPFDTEHVLYSKLRPYLNKVVRPDEPGLATTELVPLRPNCGLIDAGFLTFYLRSYSFVQFATNMVAGAKMPRMVMDKFWEHQLPLPPLSEQRRIVELLEQADALRRRRADADSLGTRIVPALFRKMFGEPIRNANGWPTENLLRICSPRQWPTISSRELLESGFPVYGANGRIGFYDSFNHEKATVLITCRGASCGTINVCEPKSYVTGNAMSLDDPDESKITNEFLEWFLRVRGLSDTITGAAQPQITRANLAVVEVLTPPKPLVDTFTDKARAVRRVETEQAASGTNIETLFQTMLYRAFTGELTAGWREAHMKELLSEMEQQARHLNTSRVAA